MRGVGHSRSMTFLLAAIRRRRGSSMSQATTSRARRIRDQALSQRREVVWHTLKPWPPRAPADWRRRRRRDWRWRTTRAVEVNWPCSPRRESVGRTLKSRLEPNSSIVQKQVRAGCARSALHRGFDGQQRAGRNWSYLAPYTATWINRKCKKCSAATSRS